MAEARRRLATIAALGVVQIFAWGSSFYLPAVLAQPIATDTGWPPSLVAAGLSAGLLVSGLVAPRVGTLIRERGGRPVLTGGMLLLAAGLATIGLAASLPIFIAGWLVIGAGMGATLYDAAFGTLGRYYGYGARSAITTLTLFGGFASTLCWPLSALLLSGIGWRGVCLTYAAIHIAVSLPLILAFLPRVERLRPEESSAAARPSDLVAEERTAFRLLAVIVTVGGTVATVVSVHLMTMLAARGIPLAAAVSLGALIGPSQVASRLFDMAIGKRFAPIVTLATAAGLIALGVVALASGLPIVAPALILYGAGNGIWSIARGAVPLALFGPDRFPVIMGRLAMPNLVAQAAAPVAAALLLDRIGSLSMLALIATACGLNVGLVGALWLAVARQRSVSAAPLQP